MQTLYDLYLQNPFWIWLAVGAVFVALDIATGWGKLIWPGVAAAILAFINLAHVRLGLPVEIVVFVGVSVAGVVLSLGLHRRPRAAPENIPHTEKRAAAPAPEAAAGVSQDRTGRLVGRIGRTTGEFVNGVGRVWIDGAEWGAEIDAGDDVLPPDEPVRVTGVTGGVRLRVQSLMG
jgi:membrane protein implicated in regulation of membrane protease activity